jgi:hypothetical protein
VSEISFPTIGNAYREKRDLEKDFSRWSTNLYKSLPSFQEIPGISMAVFEARTIEIYRLCYEQSPQNKREKVLRDFAAHFPHLIFEAGWLHELVRKSHHYGVGAGTFQGKLLLSLATGLRSAASGTRYGRQTRALKLQAARMARFRISKELQAWDRTLKRNLKPSRKWIHEQAAAKTRELVAENTRLGKRAQEQLQQYLHDGSLYEASVLLVATMFGLPPRELQKRLG